MCPPDKKIYYFYTISGIQYISKEMNIKSQFVFDPVIIIPYSDAKIKVTVKRMNYFKTNKNYKLFNN